MNVFMLFTVTKEHKKEFTTVFFVYVAESFPVQKGFF